MTRRQPRCACVAVLGLLTAQVVAAFEAPRIVAVINQPN